MAGSVRAMDGPRSSKLDRYRASERALWTRHGLEPTERWVDIREPAARLRVVEVGSGPPVMFVPGTGGIGPYWAPLVKELSGFRCLLVDRPGWGSSDPIDYRGRSLGDISAQVLGDVQEALGISTADVVGASVGNVWALGLAARRPEAVGRIVLLGGGPWREVPIPGFFKLLASPLGAIIVRLPLSAKATAAQIRAIGHGPSIDAGKLDDFIAWRVSLTRDTPSMRHERLMVQAYLDGSSWRSGFLPTDAELASVRHPVRVLYGTDDPTGTIGVWRRFVGLMPNAELDVVDRAGHMAWWDDPARVGGSVRTFLDAGS